MMEIAKPKGFAAKYVPALFEALKLWSMAIGHRHLNEKFQYVF